LTLQAAALGLTTHQMAGFDQEAARKAFAIPDEYAIGAVIALGYQDEPAALGDAVLIERETAARTRKALDEIVFSEWGKAAEI
jgi:nitroreductase